ncbi:E1A-binding protein p400 isoform X2 [Rhipicephalus sanguineus]|uniref:E1A-binding protein p400 isoform X2 n=1 Tax=Rhipicephalus sanguineus TaxID=34632 RepID=UPI001894C1D4|nr:E1A-binding protein p400 isoform X2 [Rhipicephalus sanguineus]
MVSTQTAMPPPAPPPAVSSPMNVQQQQQQNQQPQQVVVSSQQTLASPTSVTVTQVPNQVTMTTSAHLQPQQPQSPIGGPMPPHSSTCTVIPQQAIQSMTQSQLQPVQVIQQSLPNHYLPQLYSQQQMLLPGNLAIQQHSMGALQGLNLQLQSKAHVDPTKQGGAGGPHGTTTIIPAVSIASVNPGGKGVTISSAPTLVTTNCHMMGTAGKTCLPTGQMIHKGTTVMGHGGYQLPSTSTSQQTLVINPLGLISGQSILPAATQAKQMDANKAKPFMVKHASLMSQKVPPTSYAQVMSQQTPLQPKAPLMANTVNAHGSGQMATAQVINTNQFKQLSQNNPQIISSQQPTVISQAQLLGSLQALNATFPHGITWAQPGQLQSPTLLTQNPIYIRSQQSDVFLQQAPQQALHALPVATAQPTVAQAQPQAQPQAPQQPTVALAAAPPAQQPQPIQQQPPKPKQVRPASSVATQTATSTSVTVNSHVLPARTQAKPRIRAQTNRTSPGPWTAAEHDLTLKLQTHRHRLLLCHLRSSRHGTATTAAAAAATPSSPASAEPPAPAHPAHSPARQHSISATDSSADTPASAATKS